MRGLGGIALGVALAAAPASAQQAGEPPPEGVRVYGITVERAAAVDRLLVFADEPLTPKLEEPSAEEIVLRFPGARLDPSAPRQLVPGVGSAIRGVTASDTDPPNPEVLIRVQRAPGATPQLSRRETIVALELVRPRPGEERVTLRLKDAPLTTLVREVSRLTKQAFVLDERLQGQATVIVNEPVTTAEALEILHATLLSKGYAAVPAPGNVLRILPLEDAKASAPVRTKRPPTAEGAALITALVHFQTIDVEELVALLQPFTGTSMNAVAHPPTNAVILVGSEAQLQRWIGLAQALDEGAGAELAVIQLRHRGAEELGAMLAESQRDPLSGRMRADLWPDPRTNSLIARATPERMEALREQIAALDVPPETGGSVLVLRPRFMDPEKLATLLRGIAAGDDASLPLDSGARALAGRTLQVEVHPSTRSLLVSADAGTRRLVRDVVEQLDREPALIALDLHVVEVESVGGLQLGFDAFIPWTDPADPGNSVGGIQVNDPFEGVGTGIVRWARDPFAITVIGPDGQPVNVLLPRDIVQVRGTAGQVSAHMLARPHLLAASGEEQEITLGNNVPIPTSPTTSAAGTVTDVLETTISIERKDVGLRLRVLPLAGLEGDVKLTVDVELTNLIPSTGLAELVGPVIRQRLLHANTAVASGGVALLGMMLEDSDAAEETGVPFVKDAPVVGQLAKVTGAQRTRRHLLLAIQAHIERSSEERVADSIRMRLASERALARRGTLRADGSRWALWVSTRSQEADAASLAATLPAELAPRVVPWKWEGAQRYDVMVGGFPSLEAADAASMRLAAAGYRAQLVALPGDH